LPDSLPDLLRDNPDLGAVIAAWAELPEAVRAGIAAMVRASNARPGQRIVTQGDERRE